MSPNKSADPNLGLEYLKGLYTNTKQETKDPQPLFILHRDTVRAFLFEKISLFGLEARVLAWFGILLSLIFTLCTATFHDWWLFKGSLLEGLASAFAIIIFVLFLYDGKRWLCAKRGCSVDNLVDDLASRGTVIKPDFSAEEG